MQPRRLPDNPDRGWLLPVVVGLEASGIQRYVSAALDALKIDKVQTH